MSYLDMYNKWLNSPKVDDKTKAELKSIKDEEEIKSRFIAMLSFGTAGLRGILGAGLNRMNIYTVRYATQGLAALIRLEGEEAMKRGVVVAYDTRIMSAEFAREVCEVLAANGINAYLFDGPRPTPELSYAVRELNCIAGVNITASHNPKEYNGYKAYWSDGAQLSPEQAEIVANEIKNLDIFDDIKLSSDTSDSPNIKILGEEFDEKYINVVLNQRINPDVIKNNANINIIYTPFHGAGHRLVPDVLKRAGFTNITCVKEQMVLDGNFPTVKSPNPENKEGFTLAIELAKKTGSDLIIGTDPDADRLGIVVKNKDNEYIPITGNQTGVILLDYIIKMRRAKNNLPENACVIKTIVTSEMAAEICRRNNVSIENVLTGFKFIGEKMEQFKQTRSNTFIFGYEESYGYLVGDYARDKDGVVASLLIAEAAAYYREQEKTLYDALQDLYREYGCFYENTVNIYMEGLDGIEKTAKLMTSLRENRADSLGGLKVIEFKDFLKGIMNLPKSNVVYFTLEDKSVLVVRPSGTEPKVKIYIMTNADNSDSAKAKAESIEKSFRDKYLGNI